MSPPTLPAGRPRWAVGTVRAVPAALAPLVLAVLAATAGARPDPDPDRAPDDQVVVVPETTLRPPAYVPVSSGPPCPDAHRGRLVVTAPAPSPPSPPPRDPLAALAFLDPPERGALVEVDRDQAQAIVAELHAARAVIQAARLVGHQDLDETDVAERLADAVAAYDHTTGQVAS